MSSNPHWKTISELIRLDRSYGTLLLLLPTLWALILASEGVPSMKLLLVFTVGTFLMRSAGCVVNDMADQKIDRWVARTKERPLASQRISQKEALMVLFVFLLLSASLLFFLNPLTRFLSFVGLGLAMIYPFTKRITHYPQLVLGIAFAWGPLMAWAAVRNSIELPCIFIFLATLCWTMGYDTIYALLDKNDDQKIGIKSTAILFGEKTWVALGTFFALTFLFLFWVGLLTQRTFVYYVFLFLIAPSFIYQVYKIKTNPESPLAFTLFKSHVGIGTLVLIGILLDFWNQQQTGAFP
ncbi:MAG TPA: 4-hydroxybenzoate octaprenyltransferase [Nitrospiria bacterium]